MATPFFLTKWLVRSGVARWLPAVRRRLDGTVAALRYMSDRTLSVPLDDLLTAANYWQADAPDAIDLALPAPRFDLAPAAPSRLPAHARGYPPAGGVPELRAVVADRLNADPRLGYSPIDEALVTHGAAGAFHVACDTFVSPGDSVVLFDPTSPLFSLTLKHRRARLRWVPTWIEDGRARFHKEPFTKVLPGAKLLVLANPSNPTGGLFGPEDLEQIAWWADKYDVLLYCDQAFARYRYESETTCLAGFPSARKRTLVAGSVSQGHALAAARVGWLVGQRHLIRPCAATAVLSAPFVPTVCQQQALVALRQPEDTFAPILAEFAGKRQYAVERFRGLGFDPAWPAGGYFLWVPVGHLAMTGRQFADQLLSEKRVLVTPGEVYGPDGARHVRISYAIDDGRLREGLGRLAEFVGERRQTDVPAPASEPAAVA